MLTGAALDQDAKRLGLALSDAEIARIIKADKIFAGPTGAFDQARMNEILRDNGYTETSYIREQRQLAAAPADRRRRDRRAQDARRPARRRQHFHQRDPQGGLFRPAGARSLQGAAPADDAVQAYYDLRKDNYRTPGIPQGRLCWS